MSSQQEPTAVAVARAHVDGWGVHDYDVVTPPLGAQGASGFPGLPLDKPHDPAKPKTKRTLPND